MVIKFKFEIQNPNKLKNDSKRRVYSLYLSTWVNICSFRSLISLYFICIVCLTFVFLKNLLFTFIYTIYCKAQLFPFCFIFGLSNLWA